MAVEFAVFLPPAKNFNVLPTYCSRAYIVSGINNLKTMGGGHAMHELQAVLSTTVVISHTFCMAKKNELPPEGCGSNHVIL